MAMLPFTLKTLCTPAYCYLVVAVVALAVTFSRSYTQLVGYCKGKPGCQVTSSAFYLGVELAFIAFWTWILNLICKGGATWFSWVLAILPIIGKIALVLNV